MRSKVEKEMHAKSLQIKEACAAMDHVANEKATLEKNRFDMVSMAKVASVTLSDYDNSRKKVVVESAELLHSIDELKNNNFVLAKLKETLTAQLSKVTKMGDNEAKERQFLVQDLEQEVREGGSGQG